MSEKVGERAIIHKKTHLLVSTNKKDIFPKHIHRTREPIRDLVDFPTNIHRNREPIRDFVDSRDSEKMIFRVFQILKTRIFQISDRLSDPMNIFQEIDKISG